MSDTFPKDGVTAQYLCNEFIEDLGGIPSLQGLTTAQVIQDKIKPITLSWKSSYCTYLRLRDHPACHPTAQVFISHGHSYIFLDLINAISWALRNEPQTIVWIDFCAINQHAPMDWTFEWLSTTFKSAIQGMGRTIMVMSPWNDPLPFKRSWCVFEAYCTAEGNCKFEIALSKTDEEQFLKDMIGNGREKIYEILNTIGSEKSECFNESDKAAIFNVIRSSVGFSKLDSMVFKCYGSWVIDVALRALEDHHDGGGAHNGDDDNKTKKYCDLLQVVSALYFSQGNYIKAEFYSRKAVECAKKNFIVGNNKNNDDGNGHEEYPYILSIMASLASFLLNQGKYNEAEEIYHTRLEEAQAILGRHHPDTLATMNDLASVLYYQGKYSQAEEVYRECFELQSATLGKDHPHTIITMNNLSLLVVQNNDDRVQEKNDDDDDDDDDDQGSFWKTTIRLVKELMYSITKNNAFKT